MEIERTQISEGVCMACLHVHMARELGYIETMPTSEFRKANKQDKY